MPPPMAFQDRRAGPLMENTWPLRSSGGWSTVGAAGPFCAVRGSKSMTLPARRSELLSRRRARPAGCGRQRRSTGDERAGRLERGGMKGEGRMSRDDGTGLFYGESQ